ncbi:MAG: prolyl oligopeptidase family serine peptidase [Tunicatimonas sp.]|uniref:S9 family peptidase n=1 Tax=Tunicatimonas sp. TaxID=1940096 RepID=UPI003C775AB4
MQKITYLTIFIIIVLSQIGLAQKKPLTHDVYDDWKNIDAPYISNDGQHVVYEVNPAQGDGTLYLHDTDETEPQTFARGKHPAFTHDSRFVAFKIAPPYDSVRHMKLAEKKEAELPKDSLVFVNLENNQIAGKYERVKSYRLPEKASGWLAFLHESPLDSAAESQEDSTQTDQDQLFSVLKEEPDQPEGNELVLVNLETKEEWHYERVDAYFFSEDGRRLAFTQVAGDSTGSAGVKVFTTESQSLLSIDTSHTSYKQLAISRDGNSAAFLASDDSLKAENRYHHLYLWTENSEATLVADTTTTALPDNWMVSEHGKVDFSYDGQQLFFATAPRPVQYAYEEDTTLLDEERVKVDIWSWQDPFIQPMQLEQQEEEQKRSYKAVYNLVSQQIQQLGNKEIPDIQFDPDKRLSYAIGIDDTPYRKQISWEYPFRRNAYLVDVGTGEAKKFAENTTGYPKLSPGGKYAYWYESNDSSWHAYNIASEKTVNLTKDIDANFYYELNDVPALPGAYGSAGWTEDDEHILIYDYYDIWKIDPISLEATNLTNGYGRENALAFRYQKLDPKAHFIPGNDEIVVSAFNRKTRQSGYFQEHTGNNRPPEKLVLDDYRFYGLQKAQDSDEIIYRKSSFSEFPDVWLSSTDFKNAEELSDANPQQQDYLWGSAELVSWKSADGTPLDGILYKPENFDPTRKYPMMVYFYERSSNNLHSHRAPAPSRSIINFSFYVSRGYLLFVPDIVYKEGYPGESALNAVVSGTLNIMEKGFVDPDRIGMQGHSWGGYQSAYIVTRSNLFRAVESGAPVSNMTSAYGGIRWGSGMSRMFQYERTQSRIGGSLWEYPLRYIENSPLFMADKIETPLLLLHNDEDTAVPWEQGIELFVALRRLNKPAWLLNYNGEPHWVTKYHNQKDFTRRMQQFFDHYLKDELAPAWMQKGLPATLKGRTLRYETDNETEVLHQETGK